MNFYKYMYIKSMTEPFQTNFEVWWTPLYIPHAVTDYLKSEKSIAIRIVSGSKYRDTYRIVKQVSRYVSYRAASIAIRIVSWGEYIVAALVWPFLLMCTFLFHILSNQLCLANNTLYLMPETIANQTKPISIRVQSDLRQRQHFVTWESECRNWHFATCTFK